MSSEQLRQQRQQPTRVQTNIQLQPTLSHWRTVFNKYDRDRDGFISLNEFRNVLQNIAYDHDIPEKVAVKILQKADHDQDGVLSREEFVEMAMSGEMHGSLRMYFNKYIHYTVPRRRRPAIQPTTYGLQAGLSPDELDGLYEEEYSCNPPAVCMLLVSCIEIVTFVWDVVVMGTSTPSGPVAQLLIYNPRKRQEAWRFLSYMFVHIGYAHIWMNLLVQLALGVPLEMVHGWWRVLAVYLAGVVAGSLGTSISDPYVLLAGASGGVYALITAHVSTIIMNWSEMQFAPLQLLVFIILAVADVGTAIYYRYIEPVDRQIGYAAHLAGAIAGLLVGIQVLRNLEVRHWERVIWWTSLVLFAVLMIAAIIWNAAFPEYFPPTDKTSYE
ncbi:rhomboid-related protein 2 [Hetaerina americana]|uniref:rhomboid-related protein 2 n=1 Tax=Hetaerina americana TaxID=62018 RepID=UPI003A7F2EFA